MEPDVRKIVESSLNAWLRTALIIFSFLLSAIGVWVALQRRVEANTGAIEAQCERIKEQGDARLRERDELMKRLEQMDRKLDEVRLDVAALRGREAKSKGAGQ